MKSAVFKRRACVMTSFLDNSGSKGTTHFFFVLFQLRNCESPVMKSQPYPVPRQHNPNYAKDLLFGRTVKKNPI